MVSIGIQRNKDNQVIGCHMSGHAGYDEHGYDIVCAAVSVLSATAMLGLTKIAKQNGEFSNSEGQCDMVLSGEITRSGQDILNTMLLGLEEISKQYRVAEGDVITIEKLEAAANESVTFEEVLTVVNDGDVKVGAPLVNGAKVTGTVLEHGKGKKILVFKYKAKSNYRRRQGHRQPFTKVRIESIQA